MKNVLLTALSLLLMTTITQAGHHEAEEAKAETIIGTVFSEDGAANPLVAGDTALQQIWVDYIQAHNDRDLEKIAAINAEDWVGYLPDGNIVKGNEAHIEFLDAWFKSSDNPRWEVKWMMANSGSSNGEAVEHWLTTGNDITFTDGEGNEVKENHVHDVQFVGNQIKRINVYSRPASDE